MLGKAALAVLLSLALGAGPVLVSNNTETEPQQDEVEVPEDEETTDEEEETTDEEGDEEEATELHNRTTVLLGVQAKHNANGKSQGNRGVDNALTRGKHGVPPADEDGTEDDGTEEETTEQD